MFRSGTAYSLTIVNVGLATCPSTPKPLQTPCTNLVLPLPRSPYNATTSPPLSRLANAAPKPIVSSSVCVVSDCTMVPARLLLRDKLHDGQDHFFHRDTAMLEAVAVLSHVFVIIRRVDKVIIFFCDNIIDCHTAFGEPEVSRILHEYGVTLVALEA